MKNLELKNRNEIRQEYYASPIPAKLEIRTDIKNSAISKDYVYQNQCELDSYEKRDDTDETPLVALNRSVRSMKKFAVVAKKERRVNQSDLVIDKRNDDTRDCPEEQRLNEPSLTTKKLDLSQLGKSEEVTFKHERGYIAHSHRKAIARTTSVDDGKYTTKRAAPHIHQKLIDSDKKENMIITKAEQAPRQSQGLKTSPTRTRYEEPSAQLRAHPLHPRVIPCKSTPGGHEECKRSSSRKGLNNISRMDQGVFHRLYADSRSQQQLGQRRRERIEQALTMKKTAPTFKTVSSIEATEMLSGIYYRGIAKVERVARRKN